MGQHIEFVRAFFDRVWNQGDAKGIEDAMAAEVSVSGLGEHSPMNRAGFGQFHAALNRLIDGVSVTLDHGLEDGEWMYGMCTVRGKGRACGTPIAFTGTVAGRVVDGQIVEGYNHFDFLGLYQQLGLLPAQTFETCLSGERIGTAHA